MDEANPQRVAARVKIAQLLAEDLGPVHVASEESYERGIADSHFEDNETVVVVLQAPDVELDGEYIVENEP